MQRLVTNLFKATTPKGATSQDPFWDTAAQMLLLALIFYLKYEAPVHVQFLMDEFANGATRSTPKTVGIGLLF